MRRWLYNKQPLLQLKWIFMAGNATRQVFDIEAAYLIFLYVRVSLVNTPLTSWWVWGRQQDGWWWEEPNENSCSVMITESAAPLHHLPLLELLR